MTQIQPVDSDQNASLLRLSSRIHTGDVTEELLRGLGSKFGDPMVLATGGWSPKLEGLDVEMRRIVSSHMEAISDMVA